MRSDSFSLKESRLIEEIRILSETLFEQEGDDDLSDPDQEIEPLDRLLWKHQRGEFVCYIEDSVWMDHFAEGTHQADLFVQIARLCGFHVEGATFAKLAITELNRRQYQYRYDALIRRHQPDHDLSPDEEL